MRLFLAAILLFAMGCTKKGSSGAGKGSTAPAGAFVIKIDPKDHARFDQIRNAPIGERDKKQIEYLQSQGHDLQWFPTAQPLDQHRTVQIIYFGYQDYVIRWCSGAFITNKHVATAGHCNDGLFPGTDEEVSCRNDVLFAYKASKDSPVEYYSCDKLIVQRYDDFSEDVAASPEEGTPAYYRFQIYDYALFSIDGNAPINTFEAPYENAQGSFGRDNYSTKVIKDLFDYFVFDVFKLRTRGVVAVVVDPPSSNSFLATYNTYRGTIVTADENYGNRMSAGVNLLTNSLDRVTRPGNSGSPFYAVDGTSSFGSGVYRRLQYLGPLYGWVSLDGKRSETTTLPDQFFDRYQNNTGSYRMLLKR